MIIRQSYTRDAQRNVVQVGVLVMNDAWEHVTESHRDVSPFDEPEDVMRALRHHCITEAHVILADHPEWRTPEPLQDRLPLW